MIKRQAIRRNALRAPFPTEKRRGCLLGVSPKPPENRYFQGVNKSREFRVIRLPAWHCVPAQLQRITRLKRKIK
jgi:hypothetical protein